MKKIILTCLVLLFSVGFSTLQAQHPNDDCVTAGNLGTLPTPQSCTGGNPATRGLGAQVSFNLNNTNAVAANPYVFMTGCNGGGTPMPSPSSDVWYQVTVTGQILNIDITGLGTPSVGLWEGTCGSLVGRGCEVGAAGALSVSFNGLSPGTYYIQISGADTLDQGNFTLDLSNDLDCNICVVSASLTATPAPTNGTYQTGDTVTFCFDVNDYFQSATNWFHGIELTFGPGWNSTPINLVPPASCDGQGVWGYYNSVTSTATGTTYGPGFFYDRPLPPPALDGNPGNNYGDNCQGTAANWTFCWDLIANPCPPNSQGDDMTVRVNTLADGEAGGWGNIACQTDPDYLNAASLTCCTPATTTQTNVSCNGGSDGTITATAQGTGPWDYTWTTSPGGVTLRTATNVAGSDQITGLPAGTYVVTTLDNFDNCTAQTIVTITEPPALVIALDSSFNVTCNGAMDGRGYVSATGGYPGLTGYQFGWNTAPPTIGAAVTGLGPGTYTAYVADSNMCVDSIQVTITEPAPIVITVDSFFNVTCNGADDGRAYVSATGGTAPLSYSWNTGPVQNTAAATNLPPGTWTVTVTDGNGCTQTANVNITEPPVLVAVIDSSFGLSCPGANDGRAYANASGGTGPYSYSWNTAPVQNTAAATNLPVGTWTVTVTDANGCTATAQTTITQPPAVVATIDSSFNVTCNGANDGRAYASGSGGTPGYSYSWNTAPVQNTAAATNLPPGTWTVTVTDANGCTATANANITQPAAIVVTVDSSFNVTCNGANDGRAYVSATGGTAPLSYSWNTAPVQNTAAATNLPPGTWTVTVTDANGCTQTANVNITQPPVLVAVIDSSFDATCNGANDGRAYANASGGTGPYSYSWNTGPVQNTAAATNLPVGTWTVTVTDANGCTQTANAVIAEPTPINLVGGSNPSTCGNADGQAFVTASGGTPGYTYLWNTAPPQTTDTAQAVTAGGYQVVVTDANGCQDSITVNVTDLGSPTAVIDSSFDATCNGANDGRAYASATGGTGPYSYSWNTAPVQNTAAATNLPPGTWTVTVTDANGCSSTANAVITQPAAIVVTVDSSFNVTCNGADDGRAFVSATGGTAPLSYSWNTAPVQNTAAATNLPPGTWTVTVTDANGCTQTANVNITQPAAVVAAIDSSSNVTCNGALDGRAYGSVSGGTAPYTVGWSTAPPTIGPAATNLGPGTYYFVVQDANGCPDTASVVITEPPAINLVGGSNPSSCGNADGQAFVTASGGTPGYTYLWNTAPPQTTDTAQAVTAGGYQVVVTDANGCQDSITVNVTDLGSPTAVIDSSFDATCNGANDGRAYASATGGTGPYSYSWNTAPVQNTAAATNLPPGTWTVTVTDANGCSSTANAVITQPAAIVVTVDSSFNVTCNGADDGRAYVSATGGTAPLSYSWNTAPVQNTAAATNLPPGTWTVTVTDANGCTQTANVNITQPAAVVAAIDSSFNVTCNGALDGRAYGSVSGGTAPYTVGWSTAPPTIGPAATNLGPGTYYFVVQDANGCPDTASVVITEPPAINLVGGSNPSTCGNADGQAFVTASGGTPGYTYLWNTAPPQTTDTAQAVTAGGYQVVVTDANGCQDSITVNVTDLGSPTAVIDSSFDATCNGANDGRAYASATGGTGPYSYSWNTAPVQNTAAATNLPPGTWTVTVTDANGCSSTANAVITQPAAIVVTVDSSFNVTCNGADDGRAYVSATGGTAPLSYSWNTAPVQNTAAATNLPPGTWTVTVTDANGCTQTANVNITQPAAVVAAIDSSFNVTCNGALNGRAYGSVSGGTAPYTVGWSTAPPTIGPAATNLGPGTYYFVVQDANGCPDTASVVITEPPAINLVGGSNPSTCGNADGQAFVTASGGTPGYTYLWNTAPPQTTDTAQAVTAGGYQVVVTDANGCQDSITVNVTDLGSPTAVIDSSFDASCPGIDDGRAYASASGGTGPYSYSWNTSPVQNTAAATNLPVGTWTVTVTDANGCSTSISATINAPAAVVAVLDSSFNISCNGANDGRAYMSASGGSAPISFSWNSTPPQNTPGATGLPAGTFTGLATDQNGCQDSVSVTITEPAAIVVSIDSSFDALCNGSADGRAYASATGGTGPYSYSWNTAPPQNTAAATGLPAGNYTVTVTDANGCTETSNVTIGEPTSLTLVGGSNPSTCGNADGQAFVNASGGTPGYTYLWNTTPPQSTDTAQSVMAGTYQVIVTDANGCLDSVSVNVVDQGSPTVVIDSSFDAACNGDANGRAYASATGGVGPYSYSWNTTPPQTGASVTNLPAGTWTVTVSDANGCTSSANATINEPALLVATIDSSFNISCNGAADGTAFGSASGGTAPYTLGWATTPPQIGGSASNLGPGPVIFVVQDANGCLDSASVTITEPPVLVATLDSSFNVTCNGAADGQAFASATGGTPGYSYSWNTTPPQTSSNASNLGPGTWTVTVTDTNGCTTTAQATITEPAALSLTPGTNPSTCGNADGQAFVTVGGGTTPYTYLWNTTPPQNTDTAQAVLAGTYQVIVTDSNGCMDSVSVNVVDQGSPVAVIDSSFDALCFGSADGRAYASATGGTGTITYSWNTAPAQNTASITNLTAGTWTVTVTDSNNCTNSVQVTINEPPALVPAIDSTFDALCFGSSDGSAFASATGGTTPYSYVWNTNPAQNTANASNLAAGTYTVVVTDSNGCVDSTQAVIAEPPVLTAVVDSSFDALCFGSPDGSAFASASGGTLPYAFSWDSNPVQNADSATGLPAGTYIVTVTDSNNCVAVDTAQINEPTAIVLTDTTTPASCGNADGTATVFATGGTPGYAYSWNSTPVQTSATASNLLAGNYTVVVTDTNGCVDSLTTTVQNLDAPTVVSTDSVDVSCYGLSDGSAIALGSGGTGSLNYSWNTTPPQLSDSANGLAPGVWMVTVTDSLGCSDSAMVTINEPDSLSLDTATTPISCFGSMDGTATVFVTGGTPGYTYFWDSNPVSLDSFATGLSDTTYSVLVTDANGCLDSISVTIGGATPVVAGFTSNPAMPGALSLGSANVQFTNTSTGATSYFWDFGDGNSDTLVDPSHTYLDEGTFCVTLVAYNDNGCTDTVTTCDFTVTQDVFIIPNTFTPNGDQTNDFFEIVGIEQFPNNKLMIFNRWGNLVYEVEGYQNDWNGINGFNQKPLPDGAYFYIFDKGDDQGEVQGDVVIFR